MALAGRVLVAGFLLASSPAAFALNPALDVSQYAHASWKYSDGFTKGEIHSIAQTSDGYLWLATGFGLYRFDGVKAVPWQPPADLSRKAQLLPSNDVLTLLPAKDGTLWIGTRNGLASWKNGKLTRYEELTGLQIFALLEDREGSIWAGATGFPYGKFCEIRKGKVRCHPEIVGLGRGVTGLHEDAKGNLWVGLDTGVWRWKPGPPQFYSVQQPEGIQGMADAEDGGLLISTRGALKRLVDEKFDPAFPFPSEIRAPYAPHILRDRDGGLWGGTRGAGIVHWRQGRADLFSEIDGLSSDVVSGLFEDREGDVWAATNNGLDRFRELPAVTYSLKEGLSSAPGSAVLAAKDGSVWFSSRDVFNRLARGQLTIYSDHATPAAAGVGETVVRGLPNALDAALFQDSHGRIWLSSLTGIGYLENGQFISTAAPGGIVTAITEDSAGNMWVAYQDLGLLRLSGRDVIERIPWGAFGGRDPAVTLIPDPLNGGLWLGFFNGGIAWFREGRVRASYSIKDGLGAGRVSHLRFDGEGALWAATEGGLSRLKSGRISTLSSQNGLPCDSVQWSVEEDAQSVWLRMPCGLVRVARSELDAWAAEEPRESASGFTIHPAVFDASDGVRNLAAPGGQTPPVAKSPDGRLWFTNEDGIGVIDPRRLPFNNLPPPVNIERITADREVYDTASHPNPRLPPLVRDLAIDYTALSFTAPEKIQFKYKLEGKDQDWQEAGNRRQAFYNDLPPRRYRFRVMAANNSGVWNEAGASFDFSIAPKYYQTLWFQAACAIGFLALLWGLHRLRLYQVAREFNLRLEGRVGERTRISRELHDTLLQSFQGLMLRLQVVDDLLPEGKPKKELEKALERADQAIAEGRSAVYDLRSSATILNDLAQAVRALGEELATDDSAEFRLVLEGEARDLHPIIRDEIYRLAREALRNAFKHARARNIEVELTYAAREFRLRIRDDGEGIPAEILEEGRPGHYGLSGMRERAKEIGGKLNIWSGAGSGTEIELSVAGSIAYGASTEPPRFRFFRQRAG